jgi:hypothetical protein
LPEKDQFSESQAIKVICALDNIVIKAVLSVSVAVTAYISEKQCNDSHFPSQVYTIV